MNLSWEVSLFIYYFLLEYNCFTVLCSVSRHCTTKWISYYVCACGLGRFIVSDSATLWTVARQAPPSMGFSRQEYWSGLPRPPAGDLLKPLMELESPAGRFFTQWDTWEAPAICTHIYIYMGEGNGNPFQYSCLENSVDRGAWWAAVHGVAQGRTLLKWLSSGNIHIYLLPLGLPPTTTPIPPI